MLDRISVGSNPSAGLAAGLIHQRSRRASLAEEMVASRR
jgi:hypothetical protein